MAVIHVPILAPITSGIAMPYVSLPVIEIDCRIPIAAAELWMIPVTIAPEKTPKRGFLKAVMMDTKLSISFKGSIEDDIMVIPCMRIAKPRSIEPISLFFCFLAAMMRIIPMRATMSEKQEGLRSFNTILSPESMPASDRIHAVSVVPISDPKITPTVWGSSIMPELTKPTSMTVIAEDDWMAIVMMAPIVRPLNLLSVALLRSFSSLPPAVFLRESDKSFIP